MSTLNNIKALIDEHFDMNRLSDKDTIMCNLYNIWSIINEKKPVFFLLIYHCYFKINIGATKWIL